MMTSVGTSFPVHILATHPNIRSLAKRVKTEELSGLYLDFLLAYMSGLFEHVTLVHDASLRPRMVKTEPSTQRWKPSSSREQAAKAISAITGVSTFGDVSDADLTGRLRRALLSKIGPECTIPVYEK
ncbi:hypothetical protein [Rugamonas apoptosis]|uniref:Uncharacterized protein n=1 Tax=Rugamonas apoptosis TaxID=2758570 RepID=A0A7W2F801_9BURK|nr:hypothetical protein [Rugamonas apoptosis]MBA5686699.1 hypothetical protein [Rugamonas apoptosis]